MAAVPLSSEKNRGPRKIAEAVAKTKKSKYSTAWARIATVTTRRRGPRVSLRGSRSSRTGLPSADACAISVMVVSHGYVSTAVSDASDFLRIAMIPPPITSAMPRRTNSVGARSQSAQSISAVKTMTV